MTGSCGVTGKVLLSEESRLLNEKHGFCGSSTLSLNIQYAKRLHCDNSTDGFESGRSSPAGCFTALLYFFLKTFPNIFSHRNSTMQLEIKTKVKMGKMGRDRYTVALDGQHKLSTEK